MTRLLATLTLFSICFTTSAQQYVGDKSEVDKILVKVKQFSEYVMSSDYKNIAASYTDDGKIFPDRRDIIGGREKIENYWTLPEGVETPYHKIIPEEITINEDYAYDYGRYEGRTKRKDGSESSWKGKYVIVWKKVDGDWKIYLDIWNRIAPSNR